MKLEFIVSAEKNGWNVKDFLRACAISITAIRTVKYCDDGILKNGEKAHTNHIVSTGDIISVNFPKEKETYVIPQDIPLEIVYESENVIIINKPSKMAVHPTFGYTDGTLANAFCGLMQKRNTPMPFRAINRLDKNTSGLVLAALNSASVPSLCKTVQKEYYAILQGEIKPEKGIIDLHINRCENSIIQRKVDENGKRAITEYEVIAQNNCISLVKAIPITGRTHQLRVHFSHIGFPLCGDDLYGGSLVLLQRHALHCKVLRFTEPFTNKEIKCEIDLCCDMSKLLKNYKINCKLQTKN